MGFNEEALRKAYANHGRDERGGNSMWREFTKDKPLGSGKRTQHMKSYKKLLQKLDDERRSKSAANKNSPKGKAAAAKQGAAQAKKAERAKRVKASEAKKAERAKRVKAAQAKKAERAKRVKASEAAKAQRAKQRAAQAKKAERANRVKAAEAKKAERAKRVKASEAKKAERAKRVKASEAAKAQRAKQRAAAAAKKRTTVTNTTTNTIKNDVKQNVGNKGNTTTTIGDKNTISNSKIANDSSENKGSINVANTVDPKAKADAAKDKKDKTNTYINNLRENYTNTVSNNAKQKVGNKGNSSTFIGNGNTIDGSSIGNNYSLNLGRTKIANRFKT